MDASSLSFFCFLLILKKQARQTQITSVCFDVVFCDASSIESQGETKIAQPKRIRALQNCMEWSSKPFQSFEHCHCISI